MVTSYIIIIVVGLQCVAENFVQNKIIPQICVCRINFTIYCVGGEKINIFNIVIHSSVVNKSRQNEHIIFYLIMFCIIVQLDNN